MPKNWEARDKKLDRRRNGMKKAGYSLLTVIVPMIAKRAAEAEALQARRKAEQEERAKKKGDLTK